MLTAHKIVINQEIKDNYPVLHQSALNLASTQIRQVATIGGNLCTASPSGDIACALMALEASCEIMTTSGKIKLTPVTKFFKAPRRTNMNATEVLFGISVPSNDKKSKSIHSGFIKVGTRRSMECSVVSLAYHIQSDEAGIIVRAGIAIGASAPTIRFAKTACDYLIGKTIKNISQKEKEEFAAKVVAYSSPITDIRASAWYRKEVLFNISKAIFECH
jgi:CO/xanthine dehydrogenase FAD-binding subunit